MSKPLDRLIAEHAKPKHCARQELRASLPAVLDIGIRAQQQVITYQGILLELELSDDGAMAGKYQHIHQKLMAVKAKAEAFTAAGRDLARDLGKLEGYFAEMNGDMAK